MLIIVLETICLTAFAISGVMVESNRGKDIFSVVLLGWVTALGGGTIRDIVLDAEAVFWIAEPRYFWTALLSSVAAFFLVSWMRNARFEKAILFFDAVGVSLFSVMVTGKLEAAGFAPYVSVSMGLVTGVFGGVVRDILAFRPTMLNNTEFYATPVILGCSLYIMMIRLGAGFLFSTCFCMLFIVVFRMYAVLRSVRFPDFLILR